MFLVYSSKRCFTQILKLYTKDEPTNLKHSQGVASTEWKVLGNGLYSKSIDGISYGDIYSEKGLQRWIASELGWRLDKRESRIQEREEKIKSYGGVYTPKISAKSLGEPLNTTEELRLKVGNARKEYMDSFYKSHGDKESAEMMELRFQARREKDLEAREEQLKMTEDPSRSHIHGASAQLIKDELIKVEQDYVKPIAFIERSDAPGPSIEPLRLGREEIYQIFHRKINFDDSKKPLTKTNTVDIADGLQDASRDTMMAIRQGTKHDWMHSLLSRLPVRGVLSQLFHQSSPTGVRRWSIKSPLSAFGLGECSLERGKTRVRWRCVCGRQMYDDFIELRPGAAAEFENWLNNSIRNHAIPRASNPSRDDTSRSSTSSSASVSEQQQTAGSDISLQPLSWTASTMPDDNKNAALIIDVYLEKCWLLICGQPKRGPDSLLAQLDLSSKPSDKDLFDSIKKFHSSLRSTFTLRPVLKGVQTIRFVQASFEH